MDLPRVGAEISGYRLERVVARGGMSVVFEAEHLRLGRKVAFKILASDLTEDDTFRERFVRESRIAAGLDHPNIIPIYEAGESDGLLFIAMRFVRGPTRQGVDPSGGTAPAPPIGVDPRGRSGARWTPRTRKDSSTAMSSPGTSSSTSR